MAYYVPEFTNAPGLVSIRIRPPQLVGAIALMIFWLTGWTAGGLASIVGLLRTGGPKEFPFRLVWLLGWAFGEVMVGLSLLWCLWGREVITLTGGNLRIWQQAGPWHRERLYNTASIRCLRAQDDEQEAKKRFPITGGAVSFDYGTRTVYFGVGLREYEASCIVDFLRLHGIDKAKIQLPFPY